MSNIRIITDSKTVRDLCVVMSNFARRDLTWTEWDALIAAAPADHVVSLETRRRRQEARTQRAIENRLGVRA